MKNLLNRPLMLRIEHARTRQLGVSPGPALDGASEGGELWKQQGLRRTSPKPLFPLVAGGGALDHTAHRLPGIQLWGAGL